MSNMNFKQGQSISNYILIDKLGKGGNGQVWKAKGEKGEIAIKILYSQKIDGYQFKRFKQEVAFLKNEKGRKGLLNIIDHNLPEKQKKGEYAWYTMPIAKPLIEYVKEMHIDELIKIFCSLSGYLQQLHQDKIYHRDIKPDNLFWFEEEAVFSDFGLVSFPESEDLTNGDKLGPLFYIAPEMLNSTEGKNVNFSKADVYSLAKTLWVFCTGQTYPMQGEHDLAFKPILISTFLKHDRSYLIDSLINRANKLDPERRIDINDFHNELTHWVNPVEKNRGELNLEEKIKEISYYMTDDLLKKEQRNLVVNKGEIILERFRNLIDNEVPKLKLFVEQIQNGTSWNHNNTLLESRTVQKKTGIKLSGLFSKGYCICLDVAKPVQFWIGIGCEISESKINIVLGFMLKTDKEQNPEPIWVNNYITALDSAEMENSILNLLNEFKANLPTSIGRFLIEIKN